MADLHDQPMPPDDGLPEDVESGPGIEAPRRAASAQFVVDAEVGAAAAMREAMDPANQSLADALRLSYRVLQGVIVILIVLFAFSGVQTVQVGQSGVQLWFGQITVPSLEPGIRWSWLPYPAGEFVLIDVANRDVDVSSRYWPRMRPGASLEDAIAGAGPGIALKPDEDGYLLMRGGDIGHVKVTAKYQVDDPQRLLSHISVERTRKIVELVLSSSTMEVCDTLQLQDLMDFPAEAKARIRAAAQTRLDELHLGLTITEITVPDAKPAFAIANVQGELQGARLMAAEAVDQARQRAEMALINAAGPRHALFTKLISAYEDALDRGNDDEAKRHLASFAELVESGQAAGEIVRTIEKARSYQTEIEATLGVEARLFNSLLDAYRTNPQLVVRTRWMDAYAEVLGHKDTETFFVPSAIGLATLNIQGNEEIARIRRDLLLDDRNRASGRELSGVGPFIPHANEIAVDKAGHRLDVKDGKVLTPGEARTR